MMSYFSPKLKQLPKRLPRRRPIKAIPSGIGDQGIVGNWLFYYLKGGDHLHDFSPHDNHGTINGAKFVDGRYGWGLKFFGNGEYVKVGSDPSLDMDTSVTMSCWFKVKDTGLWQDLIEMEAYDDAYSLLIHPGRNSWRMDIETDTAGHIVNTFTATMNTNTWYHIVGVYDGNQVEVFKNGASLGTASVSGTIINEGVLSIGKDLASDRGYTDGIIPIVRLYKTPKTASWVKRRFERTRGIFGI